MLSLAALWALHRVSCTDQHPRPPRRRQVDGLWADYANATTAGRSGTACARALRWQQPRRQWTPSCTRTRAPDLDALAADFPTVLKRIKLLGFNAIRLPFTFADLDKAPDNRIYVVNCKVSLSCW